ncbi:MAG: cytochrome c [Gemmatimonadales bacterium]|jgi:mono/diheme cytochrome c family protein
MYKRPGAGLAALALIAAAATGCEQDTSEQPLNLTAVDSLLSELGGTLTASLERGQRWRMISSIGVGLPPNDFRPEDLPEPGSRGAGLLQVYCIQCHWLPTPQMHSAVEWPILVKRNILRMQQLSDRLGGPLTTGLIGEVVMAGYESVEIPSEADTDTIIAYLQRYALPTPEAGELTAGPGRELFQQKCSVCHELPAPSAHTATGWDRVVGQMQAYMALFDVTPLSDRELDAITGYLRERSAR